MRSFIERVRRELGEVVAFVIVVGVLILIAWGLYWATQHQWGGNPNTDESHGNICCFERH